MTDIQLGQGWSTQKLCLLFPNPQPSPQLVPDLMVIFVGMPGYIWWTTYLLVVIYRKYIWFLSSWPWVLCCQASQSLYNSGPTFLLPMLLGTEIKYPLLSLVSLSASLNALKLPGTATFLDYHPTQWIGLVSKARTRPIPQKTKS